MIQFNKPTNLNGEELRAELNSGGVVINEPPLIDAENNLWLDIAEKDKAKATSIVAAHNGTVIGAEQTIADKLANAGLSVSELKEALGL